MGNGMVNLYLKFRRIKVFSRYFHGNLNLSPSWELKLDNSYFRTVVCAANSFISVFSVSIIK